MASHNARPLAGRRVWLTRPTHQAAPWARVLEAAGAEVFQAPLLSIAEPADVESARRGLADAENADILIATSRNAVDAAWRLRPDFRPSGALLGVGAASAGALENASGRAVACPDLDATSDGLLALPSLIEPVGRRVALLSGVGGRVRLTDALTERGAQVDKIELYRRRPVAIPAHRLTTLIEASDAIVVTSGEALAHLVALAVGDLRAALADTLLVAPSARVVKQGKDSLDWTHPPVIADRMSGDGVVAALARVWSGNGQ